MWLIHKRYMSEIHVFIHAPTDVVTELVYLLSDVSEESIARPATNHHDPESGQIVECHSHCTSGSDGMGTEVPFGDAEVIPSDGFSCSIDGVNYVLARDVFYSVVSPDGRYWGVVVCTRVISYAFDYCSPRSHWAHHGIS